MVIACPLHRLIMMFIEHLYILRIREILYILSFVFVFLAYYTVGYINQLRIFCIKCIIYLLVSFPVQRSEILISYLHIFQRERFRMTVSGSFSSPFRIHITYCIFYCIKSILYIIIQLHFRMSVRAVFLLPYPTCTYHACRSNIHGISSEILAQFIKLMISYTVSPVIRCPFAPLPRSVFYRPDSFFPLIHCFRIHTMHDTPSWETDKIRSIFFKILHNISSENRLSIIPSLLRKH